MNYTFLKKCSFIIYLFLYLISPLLCSRTWKNGNTTSSSTEFKLYTSNFQRNQRGMIKYTYWKNSIKPNATGEGGLRSFTYYKLLAQTPVTDRSFRFCYFYKKRENKYIPGSRKNESIPDVSLNHDVPPTITKQSSNIFW